MKKILNWTFGSFFRTLGRTLFYFVIGSLIFVLLNVSDLFPKIKEFIYEML